MRPNLVYLIGGSLISLLLGIIVTIILPAQEPIEPSPLAKPYTEQESRGRDIYLREGCHYCHTQQVREPEAGRGMVRKRGDIGPESVPGDFYYQSPVFWGTLRQGTDLAHLASRPGVGDNVGWHELHFKNPRGGLAGNGHALVRLSLSSRARSIDRLHAHPAIAMVFPATWLVLATLGIILVLFGMGYYWARTHGQFDDVERAKFAMLENEDKDDDTN